MDDSNTNPQLGYGNQGVQLGQGRQGEPTAQTVAELRLEGAAYNFGGIKSGVDFDHNMEALAKLFYKSWVRVPHLTAVVGIVGLALYLCGRMSPVLSALMIFSMFIFWKDLFRWLWTIPREQWLADYIHRHSTRMAELFDVSAGELNAALRELQRLVPDAKNVNKELCQALHWARNRVQYANWVDNDLQNYLTSLLNIGAGYHRSLGASQ